MLATTGWGALGPLILTALAIMGSPGPATTSLVASGAAHGVRRSLPYLAGIVAGTTAVLLAVATGITAALLALPVLEAVLLGASAVYVLWLAYHIATSPPLADRTATSPAPSLAGGALLGVANPKAWVAIAAVFASAHLSAGAVADAAAKTAALIPTIVLINATWLLAGTSLAPLLRHPRRSRLVNRSLAVVLVAATAAALVH
ncbi:MAG TPA: LysE family transporter [Gaiellaceae bacterium]|nr:LysE family transporter [Gaiellaceae bacterium]